MSSLTSYSSCGVLPFSSDFKYFTVVLLFDVNVYENEKFYYCDLIVNFIIELTFMILIILIIIN